MINYRTPENDEDSYLIVDIYARLSKPKRSNGEEEDPEEDAYGKYNKRTELSLEAQVEECRRKIAENPRWREGEVFREVYTGPEFRNRTELSRARRRWANRECDIFLVYNSDRLARGRGLTVLAHEMRDFEVSLKSVTEKDLGDSPEDDLINDIRAHVSEMERLKMIDRVKTKLEQRTAMGMMNGCNEALYGYVFDKRNEKLLILEEEAKVVRFIFQWRYEGLSVRAIARRLNEKGYRKRSGKLWDAMYVSKLLRHPYYKGTALANRYSYYYEHKEGRAIRHRIPHSNPTVLPDGTVPVIIDPVLYEEVQVLLDMGKAMSARNLANPEWGLPQKK